jgi:deazaflavin-dependent oxidoreductase (nitroreductase family)
MTDPAGRQLVAWGRAVLVRTRGRRSDRDREVVVGFVEEPGGSLLVSAGSPDADWALNLLATPAAIVTVGERTWPVIAEPLEGVAATRAIRELILRYGTPSEGLGSGQSFRLRPDPATSDESA